MGYHHDTLNHLQRRSRRPSGKRKLSRSRHRRVLAGVLGGIAIFVDTSPVMLRVLYSLSVVMSFGITALVYLFLVVILPLEDETDRLIK